MSSFSIPTIGSKLESPTTNPNWLELPKEITANILHRLGAVEILTSARNVCPYWWNICKDPLLWRTIRMSDISILRYNSSNLSKIFRYAVDQSCGGLEDIYLKYFGNDELFQYVADRASQLRCLRIENCQRSLSKEGLSEAVKKFPLLEELHISDCHILHSVSFNTIGQSCPLLKSLKLKGFFDVNKECDYQAFGIGETMPGLCHLELLKINLSNVGLIAILDGCPLLESLDIRGCLHLDLSGSIGQRCKKQIKDLRLPEDYIDESDDTCGDIDLTMAFDLLGEFSHAEQRWQIKRQSKFSNIYQFFTKRFWFL
ncbi:unnamed protein product [Lathyrus sativus]|nr:unnamed protein product [Lathyrus sativus]